MLNELDINALHALTQETLTVWLSFKFETRREKLARDQLIEATQSLYACLANLTLVDEPEQPEPDIDFDVFGTRNPKARKPTANSNAWNHKELISFREACYKARS